MGTRGPAPKPQTIRVLEGGIGKGGRDSGHKRKRVVPQFAPLTDHPPDWLPREAKAEWRRLMAEFGRIPNHVQRPDRATLIGWCQEWARYVAASRDVNERGAVILVVEMEAKDGRIVYVRENRNPNVQIARDCLQQLIAISARYGLTPGDRARFDIKGEDPDEGGIKGLLTSTSEPGD